MSVIKIDAVVDGMESIKQTIIPDSSIKKIVKDNWLSYLFLLPLVLYMTIFVWYAAIQGLIMSFFNWPLFGKKTFLGLQNYMFLFTWDVFYTSIKATLWYGTQTIFQLIFGTLMALIVWSIDWERVATIVSSIFILPYVIPPIISGGIFRFLLQPNIGPVFDLLVDLNILQQPIYWMTSGVASLAVITGVGVWTWIPFVFILVLASLQGIPQKYYEAAEVYSADRWEQFRYITYPQIKSTILLTLILRIVWNLGKIAQPLQITRGGPGWKTSVLGIVLYRLGWRRKQFGRSFAVGVILALITLSIISIFIHKYEREGGEIRL